MTVLVLGATGGLGRALVRSLARAGYDLVLAGRDAAELDAVAADARIRHAVRVAVERCDLLELASHPEVVARCCAEPLAGVVSCTGEMLEPGAPPADVARVLMVNYVATVSLVDQVAARLVERGGGFVCVVSSVAGDRGRGSNYHYGSAKAGLNAYLDGLRGRLHGTGVRVTGVRPGFIDTRMTFGRTPPGLTASPEQVAEGMLRAIRSGRRTVYLPGFWRWVGMALRAIPAPLFERMRL
ncbi:MAG: SDR family NAD(P)-dependent oxidoreductase [Gemmatimonadetes bacterium]|nr:SDR family NAD(P)-dependent oxidoreductase [Gemmatimonadota bacterium]